MNDLYIPYETGLRTLLARLGSDHPRTADALVFQQRLLENIQAARRYGDTESRRAERAEIVDRLNALAQEALGVSYNALCQAGEETPEVAPPLGDAEPATHVDTGGGAFIGGNVVVQGGDFVGRDQTRVEVPPPTTPVRPPVPAEGEPLALIATALQARRLLLVWADVPFPPEKRPPNPPSLLVNRWQRDATSLPPLPWPIPQLPPVTLLSLDPSQRIEAAFRQADVPLNVLVTRRDVVDPGRHNLIKLAGDLESRTGLLLSWADVRDAPNDPDKVHLLKETQRVAREGAVLLFADEADNRFPQLWNELVHTHLSDTQHSFALGPTGGPWPQDAKHLSVDVNGVLTRLINIEDSPLHESVQNATARPSQWDTAAIRGLLTAAFSDEDLTTLCFDHFRPVYENFSAGMTKGQKIQLLLDHCARQEQTEELLDHVEDRNPIQYARFRGQLRGESQ